MKKNPIIPGLLLSFLASSTLANNKFEKSTLSNNEIKEVILHLQTEISTQYVEKVVSEKLISILSEKTRNNYYSKIINPTSFTAILNEDLFATSHDKHLRVMFTPQGIEEWLQHQGDDYLKFIDTNRDNNDNFGISDVRILDDNIGYIKLNAFYSPNVAKETIAKEISKLNSVDAIIIDLRENHGGSPEMVQLLTSYFFGSSPVHLTTFYIRPQHKYIKTWTYPGEPIIHRVNIPLYILISHTTFSAAEEFSYNLRNLKRATLVGEVTAGGAHAGDFHQLTDRFFVYMPFAKAISPITNTNWESIGVEPDIKVNAENALLIAHKKAKEKLQKPD